MTDTAALRELKRTIIDRYARPGDGRGLVAVAATLLPLAALWACVPLSAQLSIWLTAGVVALISLFLLRVFVLMHECGHGSLFRSPVLNQAFGFLFGVLAAMPQYVWSKHHLFHHATNGNWARYRGPLSIISARDYAALSTYRRSRYRHARSLWLAPIGGFVYLFVNPRLTWLRGSIGWIAHIVRGKWQRPHEPVRALALEFETPYWSSSTEYWHMFWNNVALAGLVAVMAWLVGPALFAVCYVVSIALAGGAGIVLFTVQHNFEHSYASADEGWSVNHAALHGTSMLVLPGWLNWFTANIGYHHVHHLSARVPFYRLVACHREHEQRFGDVTRLGLAQIPGALKCVLWDTDARRLITVAEFTRAAALRA